MGFDELNVLKLVDALYETLDQNNRKYFKTLFCGRYREVYRDEDFLDELADMYLAGLLSEPNENTHYAYDTEALRKRDRAKEAINAVPTKAQKQLEIDKAIRYWSQMTAWYTDFTSQGAEEEALKDSGAKRVQRHEMDDEKTCSECRKLDGAIYDINHIPPLPHLRCRRWFTRI